MYKSWTKRGGEEAETQTKFGLLMNDRGFERHRSNGIWYLGITNKETVQDGDSVSEDYVSQAF